MLEYMFLTLIDIKILMGINSKKIKGKEIYKKFELGIKQIISELKLKSSEIKIETYETEKIGVDYIAEIKTKKLFIRFHMRTETKSSNLNNVDRGFLNIEIRDDSRPHPYSDGEWFDYHLPVSRWITKFFHKRNIEMQDKLHYILAGHKIKFIGDWGISTPSANLFEIFVNGSISTGYPLWGEKIPILRIRHLNNNFRAFSYIVLLENSAFVFPDFCGPDSGEGGSAYERVEQIIKNGVRKNKIIVYDIDISYDKFKEFAVKYMSIDTFNSSIPIVKYDKYIKIFNNYLKERIFMGFEFDKRVGKQILEKLKEVYPDTMTSTELSETLDRSINDINGYISYLKDKGLLEITISTFREKCVKITSEGLDQILKDSRDKSDIIRPQITKYYGPVFMGEKISTRDISVKIEDVRNKINFSNIDNSIKIEIMKKLNEFENEIKKSKPDNKKIDRIKRGFEKIRNEIPEMLFKLLMKYLEGKYNI